MTELPYIGHVLTSEGVKPDPKKVSAIKDMEAPRNSEDVRRFLGHVNYMAKFMPNLSAESEPLRRLLNLPDNEFCWGVDQRNAYETLKLMLTSDKLLQYYDSRKPVVIQTDASTAGLGAVLMQEDKPVAYASRSLTKSESNYAPIELECLAIVFAMNKFDQYVFGHPNVTIHCDHRPLEAIMRKSLLAAPKRIQAMTLTLQRYAFTVKWKPGKEQVIADLLSRHTGNCEQPAESAAREHVFQVQQHETRCRQFEMIDPVRDCPVTNTLYVTIKEETERDKLLQQLSEVIKNGWPKDVTNVPEQVRPWWTFRDELAILDGPRVVIPTSMRKDMLKRLHVSHQGIEATLRRARQTMFWHGMAVDVK